MDPETSAYFAPDSKEKDNGPDLRTLQAVVK